MNEFSKLLFSLRKEKGFTQTELADKIGVSNKAVSKWETGESYPETAQLIALSNLFNITIDELLKGKKEEQSKISEERKEDVKTKSFFDRIFTKNRMRNIIQNP